MSDERPFRSLKFGKTLIYRKTGEEPFPHIFLDKAKPLQGWYKNATDPVRPRPCFTEATLVQPYGGYCPLSCAFCYVNMGLRGYRATKRVTVCPMHVDQIHRQISRWYVASSFYITPFHEPFNVLEETYHNTRNIAGLATELGLPVFFLSRLIYPDWAKDILQANPYSYAQKSIVTSNPTIHRKLSPGGASLEDQWRDISDLRRKNIYVSIQLNPVFLGIIDEGDVLNLIRLLAKHGANHVIVKFVEVQLCSWKEFLSTVNNRFGVPSTRIENLFTEVQGAQRTIPEDTRRKLHEVFQKEATSCGMTYATCYEYDRVGRNSLGRLYCTADQCHGKAVPIFYRNKLTEKFRPFDGCEPSGCLYCERKLCNHPSLTQAKAMRDKDYRIPLNSADNCSKPLT